MREIDSIAIEGNTGHIISPNWFCKKIEINSNFIGDFLCFWL